MRLVDLHCDTMDLLMGNDKKLYENDLCVDIKKLKKANSLAQTFALFVDTKDIKNPHDYCISMYERFLGELNKNSNDISLATNYDEIINNNKISALLSIEEGAVLEGDIKKLEKFYDLGIRFLTLTWNYENEIGYPNCFEEFKNKGLKRFGFEVIEKMNDLGMIIDVSHLSDGGFYDVYNNSKKPFIATHSNSRTVTDHSRNLTDDMIRCLGNSGGITGINFCNYFLNDRDDSNSTLEDIIKHIKHIVNVGGIEVLSIGTDFDGILSTVEIKDISEMDKLVSSLKKNDFKESEIEKIFSKNALRVIKEVLK